METDLTLEFGLDIEEIRLPQIIKMDIQCTIQNEYTT